MLEKTSIPPETSPAQNPQASQSEDQKLGLALPSPVNPLKPSLFTLILISMVIVFLFSIGIFYLSQRFISSPTVPPPADIPTSSLVPSTLSPTIPTIDISNWETYFNDELGFSLKYPGHLSAVKSVSPDYLTTMGITNTVDLIEQPRQNSVIAIKYGSLYSNFYDIGEPLSNEALIQENQAFTQYEGSEYKEEDILLDSIPATKVSYNITFSEYHFIKIYMEKEGTQIEISTETPIKNKDQFIKLFDQILSTFRFLEQPSCKDIQSDTPELTYLQAFCSGLHCSDQTTKADCESVDVVTIENGKLSESWGQDRIVDCIWIEELPPPNQCQPKYR